MAFDKTSGFGKSRAGSARGASADGGYYRWRADQVVLHDRTFTVYSKPGMLGFGEVDPAAKLLAESIEPTRSTDVLVLNCGSGLAGLSAAVSASEGRVVMADSNIVAVEAAGKTSAANNLTNVQVYPSCGTGGLAETLAVDIAAIRIPKGKLSALQLIWDAFGALKPGGRLYLAGATKEGIKTYLRHAKELFGQMTILGYHKSCRVGVATKGEASACLPDAFADEWLDHERFGQFSMQVRGKSYTVCSRPGVFSWDRLDRGTQILIEAMEIRRTDTVLDLGCGCGIVGLVAADLATKGSLYMVDADVTAVQAAQRTVDLNQLKKCQVTASDCAAAVKRVAFDVVVTNPPFHEGKPTTYDIAGQFIRDAAAVLKPTGRLYLVANRFLPYENPIRESFGNVTRVYQDSQYKVLHAVRGQA